MLFFSSTTEAAKFAYLDIDIHRGIATHQGGQTIPRAQIQNHNEEVLFACQKQQTNDKAILHFLMRSQDSFVKLQTVE